MNSVVALCPQRALPASLIPDPRCASNREAKLPIFQACSAVPTSTQMAPQHLVRKGLDADQ
jgi:hypothetical protein